MINDAISVLQQLGILQAISIGAVVTVAWSLYNRFTNR